MKKTRYLAILCLAVTCFALSACGTLRGAGEDLESAGRAVQDVVN